MKKFFCSMLVVFLLISSIPVFATTTNEEYRNNVKKVAYNLYPTLVYEKLANEVETRTGIDPTNDSNFTDWVANKLHKNIIFNKVNDTTTLAIDNFVNQLNTQDLELLNGVDIRDKLNDANYIHSVVAGDDDIFGRLVNAVTNAWLGNEVQPNDYDNTPTMIDIKFSSFMNLFKQYETKAFYYSSYSGMVASMQALKNTNFVSLKINPPTGFFYFYFGIPNINNFSVVNGKANFTSFQASSQMLMQMEYNNYLMFKDQGNNSAHGVSVSSYSIYNVHPDISTIPDTVAPITYITQNELNTIVNNYYNNFDDNTKLPSDMYIPLTILPSDDDITVDDIKNQIIKYIEVRQEPIIVPPTPDIYGTNNLLTSILKSINSFFDFFKIDVAALSKEMDFDKILEKKFEVFFILGDAITKARTLEIAENPPFFEITFADDIYMFGGKTYTVVDFRGYENYFIYIKTFLSIAMWSAFAMGVFDYFNPKLTIN